MPSEKDLFSGVKPPSIEERSRKDYAEYYAHPCRLTPEGTYLWFVGWQTQGPTLRRWNGTDWDAPKSYCVRDVKRTTPTALPGPVPEEPKK